MTIAEMLGTEYQDFLEFCSNWGKTYPDELSAADFVAFRVHCGKDREYVEEIKSLLKGRRIIKEQLGDSHSGSKKDSDVAIMSVEEMDRGNSANIDLCPVYAESVMTETTKNVSLDNQGTVEDEVEADKNNMAPNETNVNRKEKSLSVNNVNLPLYLVLDVEIHEALYRIPIYELHVNRRIYNSLKTAGIETIADMLNSSLAKIFIDEAISENDSKAVLSALKEFTNQNYLCLKYFLMQSAYPLSTIFEIPNTSQYEKVSIESVDFSVRFDHALFAHKIKSIQQLLTLSIDEMLSWKNLGRTSIEESINKLYKFLCDENKKVINIKGHGDTENSQLIMAQMLELVKSEQEPDLSIATEQEVEFYTVIKCAFDECGCEFYDAVSENQQYFRILAQALNQFAEDQIELLKKENEIDAIASEIPNELQSCSAKLIASAYYTTHHNSLDQFWVTITDDCTVKDLIREIHSKLKTVHEISHMCKLFGWLKNLDLGLVLEDIFLRDALISGRNKVDESYKDKYLYAIELRVAGETLEEIGIKLGTTRERIRQIERKFTQVFADRYKNNLYDTFLIIHALRGGDKVLTYDEVSQLIGERFVKLLWHLLSKGLLDNNTYKYSKKYNSVIFTSSVDGEAEKMEVAFEKMPEYFLANQYDSIVDTVVAQNELHRELFEMFIEDHYQFNGMVYSKQPLTVIFMVGYVLKERFINGYKIAVPEEVGRFKEYMMEFFGDRGKKTARAIDAVVGQIGVLVDRGKYVHTDYVNVDSWIMDEINAYVESNAKSVIPFSEIYDALKDVLAGTIITNRYILQGAVKKYGSQFTLAKDYITKEKGKSLTDEFEDFAKEIGEFTKEDFFAAFPALGESNLGMLIGRCKNVFNIDNGLYMHSALLNLNDVDYVEIRKYLLQACCENPVNSRTLFDEFSYRFIDFMDRNDIGNHGKLFGVLNYMFADEFNFSRPYIARRGTGQITNKAALMGYIGDIDSISIEEAVNICADNGIRSYSVWNVMRMLAPEYIRINRDMLLKFSLTGIDDEVIEKVISIVNDEMAPKGYISSALINDYLFYPQININWNPYLVEAIADLAEDRIGCINITMSSYEQCTHIFVSKKYVGKDYQQFLLELLDEAFAKGSFSNKSEMREWLCDRGLITTNGLPKFLEETKYYFMDDNGCLKRTNA